MRPLIGIHGVTSKEDLLTGETNRKALAPLESGVLDFSGSQAPVERTP